MEDGVVGKRRVRNTVGSTEKHLERNVGYQLAHLPQAVPGVLVQEAHGNVEGGATPALQSPGVGVCVGGLLGDVEKVNSSHTGGQERLMSITPCGVHDKTALVLTDGLGESLRTLLEEDVPPALLAWLGGVDLVSAVVGEGRDGDHALELGLANLTLDLAAVDSKITEVGKELLSTVLGADEIEKRRCVVDEGSPALSVNECGVCEELDQEGNVGLDTTDTELNQRTKHLSAGDFVCGTTACALDQHGVVVRGDDSTRKTVSSIETDTVTASGTVDLNLASVGSERLGWVLCSDTALEGETTCGDVVLGQTKLLERCTSGDLDLSCHNINTSDLLSDGVLDLDTRVNFYEVVPKIKKSV